MMDSRDIRYGRHLRYKLLTACISMIMLVQFEISSGFQPKTNVNVNFGGKNASQMHMSHTETETDIYEDCYRRAEAEHEKEIANGSIVFGHSCIDANNQHDEQTDSKAEFNGSRIDVESDDASFTLDAGIGNAGPDEFKLKNGHLIHGTTKPIFTPQECQAMIDEARATITKGQLKSNNSNSNSNSIARGNAELGEARLSELPMARQLLQTGILDRTLLPFLKSRFGTADTSAENIHDNDILTEDDELVVYDGLIIGHLGPSRTQPVHRDSSLLTLNVALSPLEGYKNGGGTYFESVVHKDLGSSTSNAHRIGTVHIEQGHVLCHAGGVMHAGIGIDEGERWIMVLFVLSKKHVQIARRLHAMGGRITSGYDTRPDSTTTPEIDEAETIYAAGMKVAPKDHLLVSSIGSIYNQRGDHQKAEQCLRDAATYYPPCHKAAMGLGQMLMARGQMLMALDAFNGVLGTIGESDLRDGAWGALKAVGWNARMNAAQCSLTVAQTQLQSNEGGDSDSDKARQWAKHQLPQTLQELEIILQPIQQDEGRAHIISMINAAEEMLELANQ